MQHIFPSCFDEILYEILGFSRFSIFARTCRALLGLRFLFLHFPSLSGLEVLWSQYSSYSCGALADSLCGCSCFNIFTLLPTLFGSCAIHSCMFRFGLVWFALVPTRTVALVSQCFGGFIASAIISVISGWDFRALVGPAGVPTGMERQFPYFMILLLITFAISPMLC